MNIHNPRQTPQFVIDQALTPTLKTQALTPTLNNQALTPTLNNLTWQSAL